MQLARPSLVLNAAAYTNVDQAEIERDEAFRANGEGPKVLAQACAEKGIPLIHISTDYVFDGRKPSAYTETDPIAPINAYGQSKLAGEIAVRDTLDRHVILRTSWVFGIYGRNFLKTMLKLAAERDELRVVADQRGCPTSTADLTEAIVTIAPRLIAGEPVCGLYNVVKPAADDLARFRAGDRGCAGGIHRTPPGGASDRDEGFRDQGGAAAEFRTRFIEGSFQPLDFVPRTGASERGRR